jgi:hypothetical protein
MMGRWANENMEPDQREFVRKRMEKNRKDWEDLRKKVEAGEVTEQEAQKLVRERVGDEIRRFMETFGERARRKRPGKTPPRKPEEPEKVEEEPDEADDKPAEEPAEKEAEPDPKKGDDKPVPPAGD